MTRKIGLLYFTECNVNDVETIKLPGIFKEPTAEGSSKQTKSTLFPSLTYELKYRYKSGTGNKIDLVL